MSQPAARHRKASIKTKVTITTFIMVSVLLIAVSVTLFSYSRTLLQESILKQQFILVTEIAEQLNGRIKLARQHLTLAATNINSRVLADPLQLQHILAEAKPLNLIFDAGLVLIGTDGRVITENMGYPALVGADLRFSEYVSKPLQDGQPFISAPFRLSIPPHTPMIAMVVPVKDTHNRIICLLAGYHTLGANQFLTSLSPKQTGTSGYLYLLHGRTLLMHPDSTRILEQVMPGKNRGIDQALQGFEGSLENINSKGQHMLSSFTRVDEAGWILCANTPYDEAFAPLKSLAVTVALISTAGILLSLLAAWYIARRMTQPINQLITHIDASFRGGGDWKPLELTTGDELEHLADSFNGMMNEVQQTSEALERSFETHRIVAQYTSEIAVWITLDGTVQFISDNCFDITGYRDTDFYENPTLLHTMIHPDDRQHWDHHTEHPEQGDCHAPVRMRIICRDGSIRWMAHSCHKVRDNYGQVSGIRGSYNDITDTVLAQQQLTDEKLFVENLINSATTPIFVINRQHTVLYWNKALESITGKTAADLKGTDLHWTGFYETRRQTLADLIIDKQNNLEGFYDAYSPSKYIPDGFQAEGWFQIGGKRRYLFFEAAPICNSDNEIIAVIETLQDISERRQMEDSLARLSRAVEQSPATIVMTDVDGTIEYVNPKFFLTTGYRAQEAVGQNPRILKSGEMPAEGYTELWKTITSGKEWRGEFHNKRKDGTLYWELASISALYDKDGRITGYLAVKEDITERKAIETDLTLSRLELEASHVELGQLFKKVEHAKREWEQTLDHLRDFVILTDTNHRIMRYNKLLSDATGRPINELIGADWQELIREAGFNFVSFNGTSGEISHRHSGRSYDITVYPVDDSGALTGYVVSINDTTDLRATTMELEKTYAELKEAQLQIFQQEKMASIGQLAAGVAHEINNPMGFISSNLSTLNKYIDRLTDFIAATDQSLAGGGANIETEKLKGIRKQLKIDYILDDSRQLIAESQDGAGRVRRIVQDLKSFSRVDQAECGLINLNEALETTINIAWNEIKYVASLNREFGTIPDIFCFPQQLNQVFLNLLVNAAHAIGETQGVITVRTWSDGADVLVSVTDSGCGIPEEIRQRIFEPFFTTKEVGRGTGLGLSISYDIIRKHGGEITVESEVGHGTTFIVRLPVSGPQGHNDQHIG